MKDIVGLSVFDFRATAQFEDGVFNFDALVEHELLEAAHDAANALHFFHPEGAIQSVGRHAVPLTTFFELHDDFVRAILCRRSRHTREERERRHDVPHGTRFRHH